MLELELSLNGRSEDALSLPSRLKAKWRGVNGEIGAPCLTRGEVAIGGNPGVRGIIPGADMLTLLGDFRTSFVMQDSELSAISGTENPSAPLARSKKAFARFT